MKVLYVANHGQTRSNDDEGSIADAFVRLGHKVECLPETDSPLSDWVMEAMSREFDMLLFHKWCNANTLQQLKLPKVFWYFDLVNWPGDPTIRARCKTRIDWMSTMIPIVDAGFCTDGTWVEKANAYPEVANKLIWLTQGADQRIATRLGFDVHKRHGLLFTGIKRQGGLGRLSFVENIHDTYGEADKGGEFKHISTGCYGKTLLHEMAKAQIILAPDSPVTNNYWSNRVYITLGFGGFILHPYCSELAKQYQDGMEIVFYHNRDELHKLILYYLENPAEAQAIAKAGYERTKKEHLYVHRVESLIKTLTDRRIIAC